MRISKAIKPILEALGAPASEFGGKSLSKIANYVAPYAIKFIEGSYCIKEDFILDEESLSETPKGHTGRTAKEIYDLITSGKTVRIPFINYPDLLNHHENHLCTLEGTIASIVYDAVNDKYAATMMICITTGTPVELSSEDWTDPNDPFVFSFSI